MTLGVITQLERELALKRLSVAHPRFCLDTTAPPSGHDSADLCVPRSQVARDRQRHFRAPAKAGVETSAEALQQSLLWTIPHGIAGRVGSERQVETHNRAVRSQEFDVGDELASFHAADPRVRAPERATDFALAQSGGDPRRAAIFDHTKDGDPTATPTSIGGSFHDSHVRGLSAWRLRRRSSRPSSGLCLRSWAADGTHGVRDDRRDREIGAEPRRRRSIGTAPPPIGARRGTRTTSSVSRRSTRTLTVPRSADAVGRRPGKD